MPRLALLFLVVWMACPAHGQTYRDEARHWQVSLPDGWRSVPEIATQANAGISARHLDLKLKFSYIAAFKSAGHPYALVQFTPMRTRDGDLDGLAKELGGHPAELASEVQSRVA